METLETGKKHHFFVCKLCDFSCSKKGDYKRHLLTQKHKWKQNDVKFTSKNIKPEFKNCVCGKVYKSRSGLWKHQMKCEQFLVINENNENNEQYEINKLEKEEINLEEKQNNQVEILVNTVLQENKELRSLLVNQQKQIQELIPKVGNNTNNVNINLFLNSQCKDALNIMDFVNMLPMNSKDLETVAELGFVDGISKMFIKQLQNIDFYKRPIHCCDLKKEVLYVKNDDTWNLETDDKPILRKAITQIKHNNITKITDWVKENPSCMDGNNTKTDTYHKIIDNSIGGNDEIQEKNVDKIIKNVAKKVCVKKDDLQITEIKDD
jgi:hypothetical protein